MHNPEVGLENLENALESLECAEDNFDSTPRFRGKVELVTDLLTQLVKEAEPIKSDYINGIEPVVEGESEEEA